MIMMLVILQKTNVIFLKEGLSPKETLYCLAHELGHAVYKHSSRTVEQNIKEERQAIIYSIRLAKQYNFYSKHFKNVIKRQRYVIKTKWYSNWLKEVWGYK